MSGQSRRKATSTTTLQVLYDGGCPLCRREIGFYQRLRPRRPVQWIDIHADRSVPGRHGISWPDAMARFHVLDGQRVDTGAAAFLTLWAAMPGWRHLATLIRAMGLLPLLEFGYAWFARRRLRRRCSDEICRPT